MEKRILVAGCSHYLREYITNGLYCISKEYYLRMLYKNYDVYNLSKKNLTSKEALQLIKAFLKLNQFEYCVVSLGEGDMGNKVPMDDFRKNLMEIVSICNYYGVKVILQDTMEKKYLKEYQDIIEEVRGLYNLKTVNYHKALLAI